MSFIDLRSYYELRMSEADPDLREWTDAFNIDNIPASILDKSWHIRFETFVYVGSAHTCLGYDCPTVLEVILKGYRNPKEAIDSALVLADAITKKVTDPVNRLNQPKIKNVLPGTVSIRELSNSNDNAVILELQFTNRIFI